jgi:signal transduction histidine kinase
MQDKDESLGGILDNSKTANRWVSGMLASLSEGKREQTVDLDLKDYLEVLVRTLQGNYRMERIRFFLEVKGVSHLSIRRGELEQVLHNLIRNAVQAFRKQSVSGEKSIQLTVNGGKAFVTLDIRDNAGGISADKRTRLFDPPSLLYPKGLGLYLSKQIMSRMGGRLEYYPLDRGSRFRLTIPLHL